MRNKSNLGRKNDKNVILEHLASWEQESSCV